eukprot:SAG25_NODE_5149_length_696_cov_1.159129_1_plen_221_part_10
MVSLAVDSRALISTCSALYAVFVLSCGGALRVSARASASSVSNADVRASSLCFSASATENTSTYKVRLDAATATIENLQAAIRQSKEKENESSRTHMSKTTSATSAKAVDDGTNQTGPHALEKRLAKAEGRALQAETRALKAQAEVAQMQKESADVLKQTVIEQRTAHAQYATLHNELQQSRLEQAQAQHAQQEATTKATHTSRDYREDVSAHDEAQQKIK